MPRAETIPVIVGVGEITDRPASIASAREPVTLMVDALRAAEADAGRPLLARIDSLDLVGLVTWRYQDPVRLLCTRLGIQPARMVNASMGGETPVRLLHEAALAITRGERRICAFVGGEALHALAQARRQGIHLDWTPLATREETVRFPSSRYALSPIAKQLGMVDPAQIYPLYENAAQATWEQTPAEAQSESAELWARYAAIAEKNPYAWIKQAPKAQAIALPTDHNRLVAWPYPKLMVANPNVNQAAAVIVMSQAAARSLGIADERMVHIWGGAAAQEPEDYLQRDRYDRSTAQDAALRKTLDLVGADVSRIHHFELYSCFPVVPKMALRALGLRTDQIEPTVTGGLTFFGGPLNNYMSHAICAMVRRLREKMGHLGLLYGQGGFVNKHHGLILASQPPEAPLTDDYSAQALADAARDPVPALQDDYRGPALVETHTVLYERDGAVRHGIVIARTPQNTRLMARVAPEDHASMLRLQALQQSAVGAMGEVSTDDAGLPCWTLRTA